VISLSNECHVYANEGIVSFLYDRPECKPKGSGEHRCDVILIKFSMSEQSVSKQLWIIERKSHVGNSEAETAIEQIEGCLKMIKVVRDRGWVIKKCVIGESYVNNAARKLGDNKIMHFRLTESSTLKEEKDIVDAVKKITGR
jgi:hypothetical protein